MTMPNFLIIGAFKSGTTSLYHYLRQHPQIYMSPVKEPSFFAFEGAKPGCSGSWRKWGRAAHIVTDIEAYRALFRGVVDEPAIGEASPVYLTHPKAPACIRRYIPEAKLIAILRNPVECVYSTFLMHRLYGFQPLVDFDQAIHRQGTAYLKMGFYYNHLKRYFNIFDQVQIRVFLFNDFKSDPLSILQDIFRFLGVCESFIPDLSIQYNTGGMPKNRIWHTFFLVRPMLRPLIPAAARQRMAYYLNALQTGGLVKPPPPDQQVRTELIEIYREDILRLQQLIHRDLSEWLA